MFPLVCPHHSKILLGQLSSLTCTDLTDYFPRLKLDVIEAEHIV